MPSSSLASRSLVTLQFLCLGYFILFHPIIQPFGPQDIVASTLVFAGLALGVWAFITLRHASHFRIVPELDTRATLVTTGPYTIIRHPMYTALLLITCGLFLNYPVLSHFLAFSLLFIIFNLKINIEESFLKKRFPDYTTYRNNTQKLIPFLY